MKHKFKLTRLWVASLLLLFGFSPQAWAGYTWLGIYGDVTGGWSTDSNLKQFTYKYNNTDGKFYIDFYMPANSNKYWRLWTNNDLGPSGSSKQIKVGDAAVKPGYNGKTYSYYYYGNAGIIRIAVDQTSDEWAPYMWIERPKVKFKHPWGTSSEWTEKEATDNNNGTYTLDAQYGGTKGFNAGSSDFKYNASKTTEVGSPTTGDKCQFKWDANGYKQGGGETADCGTFTITRYMTVSFYDGSTKLDDVETLYNTNITTLAAPTKTGYDFVEWNTKADGTGTNVSPNVLYGAIKSDMNLYAKWTPKNYTITYDPATASHFTYTTAPTSGVYNTKVAMEFTPDANYVIASVTAYKTGATSTKVTVTKTNDTHYSFTQPAYGVTVEVSVSLSQVNVTYGVNGSGQIIGKIDGASIGTSPTQVDGGSTVIFTATPSTGYHVVAWYTNSDCTAGEHDKGATSYTINNIDADANVYVKFAPNTYSVKFNGNGSTSGSMTDQAFTYDAAQNLTVNAFKRTGYTFQGWAETTSGTVKYQDKESVSNLTTTNGGTVNLYAVWKETIYENITVASNSTDKGTVNQTSVSFGYTTKSASITATPKAGYYFTGWTLPANATYASGIQTSTTITVKASGDDAVTGGITANFAERWVLRGSKKNSADKGGMPANDAAGLMTTVTDGVASIVVTLEPNIDYQFKIFDKKSNSEKGQKNEATLPPMTEENSKWTLDGTNPVYLATVGHEQYTIYVAVDEENPKVYYSAPPSYQITMGTKTTSEGCAAATPGNGGNLTAEDGDHFPISDGKYVKNNGSVTFTATSNPGYSFAGFYSDAECNSKLSDDNPYTISNISTNTAVYAKFTENLTDVTVFDGQTTTTIQAGVVSHPQIVAQDVDGRKFTGWSCEGVSVENTKAKTTTINSVTTTVNTHKVTATYGELDAIYFDISNATQWTAYDPSDMWVFFYAGAYWSDADGTGTITGGSYKGDFVKMERVNPNDCSFWVAYYDADKIQSWGSVDHVAFADHVPASAGPFLNETTVSYFSFNHCMNTCVLSNNNGKNVTNSNRAYYRNEGFWKNYNAESSGLYLKMEGETGDGGQEITTKVSADTYSISLHLNTESAGYLTFDYYFYISSCDGTNFTRNSGQITAENPKLNLCDRGTNIPGNKVTLHATATGSYKILVTHKNDNTLDVTVEYPVSVGDFRVVSVIGGDAHDNGYLYKSSTTGTEMASFYVENGATIKLQRCSTIVGTNVTWEDVQSIEISGLDKPGYYNYTITHNGTDASIADAGEYEGNFYLRTDVVAGGWSNYLTNPANIMQENEYGMNDAQSFKFTHAYTNHVGYGGNVKFVIANDYSKCITDTLAVDDFIKDAAGNLPSGKDANVRFMWNKNNNTIARAYIGGSANTTDRYLILLGNKNGSKSLMVDENGNAFPEGGVGRTGLNADEAIFKDLGNWVYQVNIKAFSGAAVKLMADFAGETQYFVGAAGDETGSWRTIMAGSETENPYTMRAVYDFKSNRLVAGFVPDGNDISSQIVLNGDLLILREEQQSAKQIKFGAAAEGKTPSISAIDHIYCGLQINKSTMLGAHNSDYAKTMFWVSFPFEVNINEIFGVDGYGTKWIIQKYNGQKRADIGWFKGDGTETFWEFMEYEDQLKAYEGYLFMIDANYFDETTDDVWKIATVDHVTFYFPSADGSIGIVQKDNFEQDVPERPCGINREFEGAAGKTLNHMNTDSHWNVIGVPAFQNKMMALSDEEVDTDLKAIYEWNSTNNSYNVRALNTQFEFRTMYSYMAQFGGKINWTDVSVVSNPAPAPYAYADAKNYMIELFFNGNGAEDHTYINLADGASTDFVLNEDMMKIDNAGFPNIYSFAGNYNVAYNETKMENQSVMLGVSAPKNGSYTFAMPKDFSGKAVLVDLETGEATDLNLSNYTVELNKGTYNNRFQLLLEVEAKAPTAIDNAKGEWSVDGKTKKLFINDNIYLINAGRIYNVLGVGE